MNLKEARDEGKLKEFIREQEKKHQPGRKGAFTRLVKNMTAAPIPLREHRGGKW